MSLLKHFLSQHSAFQNKQHKLLIAVSGGIDSMVLLHLCQSAQLDIAVAHCNFQLRERESDADEELVKQTAKQYGITCYTTKFETEKIIATEKKGVQEVARNLRYEWFEHLLVEHHFAYLLTGHHANDNAETMLFHFCKGTGIKGLRGIPITNKKTIRPLLFISKEALVAYATEHNIAYRNDASNEKNIYTRNALRLDVFPQLKKIFPTIENNMAENAIRFAEIEQVYEAYFVALKKKLFQYQGNSIRVSIPALLKQQPLTTSLYELFKEFGIREKQIQELFKLLHTTSGKNMLIGAYRLFISRSYLVIDKPNLHPTTDTFLIDQIPVQQQISTHEQVQFEWTSSIEQEIENNTYKVFVNPTELVFPLCVRRWKAGDYFYPLGLGKKKKLKKFFADKKLNLAEKENVWVVESNKKIIWVIGYCLDNRFAITPKQMSNREGLSLQKQILCIQSIQDKK